MQLRWKWWTWESKLVHGAKKYQIFTNNSHYSCIGIVCYGYNYNRILLLLPLPLTMYARPCECQHKIEEDYLFAFTWRLRQAHGKQVCVHGTISTKTSTICAKNRRNLNKKQRYLYRKESFDIKDAVSLNYVSHRAVTHSDSTEMGNRLGSKRGF